MVLLVDVTNWWVLMLGTAGWLAETTEGLTGLLVVLALGVTGMLAIPAVGVVVWLAAAAIPCSTVVGVIS